MIYLTGRFQGRSRPTRPVGLSRNGVSLADCHQCLLDEGRRHQPNRVIADLLGGRVSDPVNAGSDSAASRAAPGGVTGDG
jgi:hypothetical protein